jgi:hypothetical protein
MGRRLLVAIVLLAAYTGLAVYVLHGEVAAKTLVLSLDREIGSGGLDDESLPPCRPREAGAWSCEAFSTELSGTVRYDVVLRPGTSCWDALLDERFDARAERHSGPSDMPTRASGCVHRWQWTVVDVVDAVG